VDTTVSSFRTCVELAWKRYLNKRLGRSTGQSRPCCPQCSGQGGGIGRGGGRGGCVVGIMEHRPGKEVWPIAQVGPTGVRLEGGHSLPASRVDSCSLWRPSAWAQQNPARLIGHCQGRTWQDGCYSGTYDSTFGLTVHHITGMTGGPGEASCAAASSRLRRLCSL
jgi:hypothetical protein